MRERTSVLGAHRTCYFFWRDYWICVRKHLLYIGSRFQSWSVERWADWCGSWWRCFAYLGLPSLHWFWELLALPARRRSTRWCFGSRRMSLQPYSSAGYLLVGGTPSCAARDWQSPLWLALGPTASCHWDQFEGYRLLDEGEYCTSKSVCLQFCSIELLSKSRERADFISVSHHESRSTTFR